SFFIRLSDSYLSNKTCLFYCSGLLLYVSAVVNVKVSFLVESFLKFHFRWFFHPSFFHHKFDSFHCISIYILSKYTRFQLYIISHHECRTKALPSYAKASKKIGTKHH